MKGSNAQTQHDADMAQSAAAAGATSATRGTPGRPGAPDGGAAASEKKGQSGSFAAPDAPRWWRQIVVTARRVNAFAWLETLAVAALILALLGNYYAYSTQPEDSGGLPALLVSFLLVAVLLPAMAILVLIGRRMALRRAAGSTARLHVRLVFFFSMVAAVPTLLVAGFAAFLFQTGVAFWFSGETRGLMDNANKLATDYYDSNQREVEQETIIMASQMRDILLRVPIADPDFPGFYTWQSQARQISQSAILQRMPDGTLRTAAVYDVSEDNNPLPFSTAALPQLDEGALVVVKGSAERIAAIAPIDAESGVYLYNARTTQADRFNSWANAQAISAAYDTLTGEARDLQLRFNIALVALSLLLVGIAVWFALRFADRQVEPLTDLIGAARKVGQGNFALRVEGRTGADEIGLLNRAFNRMTAQLEKQTDALVSANRQIDDRRVFTEAVLESVTAGVISVDEDNRILLMNGSAQGLLSESGTGDLVGQSLEDLAPEICAVLREEKDRAVVTHPRGGELLTLAVTVSREASGYVVTFEDITRQLLDQRQAAWSDVARRIAHEIKNPLTPIQLATERLKRRYRKQVEEVDGELFDELTNTIVRQVGDLRKMVDEFSSFARLPKPMFRNEDALDLVRQAIFLQQVAHPQISFSEDASAMGEREIQCDRHQLGQAMTNVLKNAVEAVEARAAETGQDYPGRVAVTLIDQGEWIAIEIEDNGIGLPTDRERIVEPYVTNREKGTGLGLAIVNKIVDEHGGDMSFASTPDNGTRVTLRFARHPQSSEGEAG